LNTGRDQLYALHIGGGNGEVVILPASVPVSEPASLALFGSGLLGLGLVAGRRRVR
jgi:hypothetical protein